MFVYGTTEPLGQVVLEDKGFFLVFSSNHDDPSSPVSLTAYPPGSTPPSFGKKEGVAEIVGCVGVLRLRGLNYLIVVQEPVESVGLQDADVREIESVLFYNLEWHHLPTAQTRAHPCFHIRRVLESGSFYFSKSFDLTTRLVERLKQQQQRDDACEPKSRSDSTPPTATASPDVHGAPEFVWNTFLLQPLQRFRAMLNPTEQASFDARFFILPVVQGYYGAREVQLGEEKVMLSVVSRRGWRRAGTRFEKRGIDLQGNVGNFAETETILQTSKNVVSFVQVRGSVPLEWKEDLHLTGPVALFLAEPMATVSLPPFLLHIHALLTSYTSIHILSLLSDAKTGPLAAEAQLGDAYEQLCSLAQARDPQIKEHLVYEEFSIRKEEMFSGGLVRIPKEIADDVEAVLEDFGATVASVDAQTGKLHLEAEQKGAFRVNCRDCLDRSNLGQFSLSGQALEKEMDKLGLPSFRGGLLEQKHGELWAANGDALSQIYAGSPAMNSLFIQTGVDTPMQTIDNVRNSEKRKVQAELYDTAKNRAIEILTGQWRKQEPQPVLVRVDPTGKVVT
ncbi:hypothetical protein JCM1840_000205 [Sporobolomyces johnsonii]